MSTHEHRETAVDAQTGGRIRVRTHDTDALEAAIDDWDDLSKYERWLALQPPEEISVATLDPPGDLSAERVAELATTEPPAADVEFETTNTTTDELNEYIVDNLDPNQSTNEDATHLGIGDDGGSGTSSGDTSLNNQQGRFAVTDEIDNGDDLRLSTFLDSSEANGVDIDEVGIFTSDTGGLMLNHSAISVIDKDSSNTATIDVTLEFRPA